MLQVERAGDVLFEIKRTKKLEAAGKVIVREDPTLGRRRK